MNEDLPKYQPIGMKSKLAELEEKLSELKGTNSAPKRSFMDVMTGKTGHIRLMDTSGFRVL